MEAKIAELIEAIRAEMAAQQASLAEWGLTDRGQRRILMLHEHFLAMVMADLRVFEMYRTDITARLESHLLNVRAIPNTALEQRQKAEDADWAGEWGQDATHHPITLFEELWPRHQGTWIN